MCVHRIEGGLQAALALGVDLGDAGAQLGDGGLDVDLLLVHALELLGETGEVLVGLQIDAAQPLAVGLEAQKLGVGIVEAGELSVRLRAGQAQGRLPVRIRVHRGSCALPRCGGRAQLPAALPRARAASRSSDTAPCAARSACAASRWAVSAAASASAAACRSASALPSSVMSFWRCCSTMAGRSGKTLDLRACLGDALFERGNLLMGAGRACLPALAFSCDGCLPFRAGAMLTLERDELGLGFADARPEFDRRFLRGGEIGFQRFHAAEGLHGGLGFGKLGVGFEQSFLRPLLGIGDACELGLRFPRLTLHGCQGLACLGEAALTIPPELAQAPFFALCRPQAPGSLFRLAARCFGGAALHVLLPGKKSQPTALLQAAGRGNGALRSRDKTVPAPQVALHRHQTLARLELTLQPRAVCTPHDADLLEPPREFRRCCNPGCKRFYVGQQVGVGHRCGIERPVHGRTGSVRVHRDRRRAQPPVPARIPMRP